MAQGPVLVIRTGIVVQVKLPQIGPQRVQPTIHGHLAESEVVADIEAEPDIRFGQFTEKGQHLTGIGLVDILQHEAAAGLTDLLSRHAPGFQAGFQPGLPVITVPPVIVAGMADNRHWFEYLDEVDHLVQPFAGQG